MGCQLRINLDTAWLLITTIFSSACSADGGSYGRLSIDTALAGKLAPSSINEYFAFT